MDTDTHEQAMRSFNTGRYRDALAHAPDFRDPDHPGCERCEPDNSQENDDTD